MKKLAVLFVLGGICFCCPTSIWADSITLLLEFGEYTIKKVGEYHRIDMEGFIPSGSPGNPMLPYRVYNLALPINVNWRSLRMKISHIDEQELEGEYYIEAAPPAATWTPEGDEFIDWGTGKRIVNGRNMNVYDMDRPVLKRQIYLLPYSQMRKWKYTKVNFSPFNWNPATGRLTLIRRGQLEITYQTRKRTTKESILLKDTKFDHRAEKILHNILPAKKWYKPGASEIPKVAPSGGKEEEPLPEMTSEDLAPETSATTADYVIITTSTIQSTSTKLNDFVTAKGNAGFTVEVVTESSYDSGLTCDQRANNIRSWLASNYASKGIEYVLLIGNPHPTSFDTDTSVPMKMCYPRSSQASYKESPTDFFYADLTGNWNIDGDSYYGEYGDPLAPQGEQDFASGGVDRAAEVFVGRLPFYGNYTDLDSILQKTINYEADTGDIAWRGNCLFAAGFQDDGLICDGAELMEDMWNDYISSLTGYTRYTLYQQGSRYSGCDSIYPSDNELRGNEYGTDINHLKYHWVNTNDYGIVVWWAHGADTWSQVGTNNYPDGTLLSYTDSPGLDNNHPSIHIPVSCNNGYPENSNNLSYSLLKNGAICSFGPSRVTWFMPTTYFPQIGIVVGDNASYPYYALKEVLTNGRTIGEALFFCKDEFNMGWDSGSSFMNCTGFNLYGDPSLNPGRGAMGTSVLNTFASPDIDGDYTASWSIAAGASKYELQEAAYGSYDLSDGAEAGLGNWTCTGRWEQSSQQQNTGSYSFRCSTNNGFGVDTMTLNQEFKVSGATSITFYSRVYYFHENEYVKFQIFKNGGTSWNDLWSFYSSTSDTHQDWTQVTADLTSYVGQSVKVRFYYGKDGGYYYNGDTYPYIGAFIDDFSLANAEQLNWSTLSSSITLTYYDITGKSNGTYYYHVRALDALSNPGWWSNIESIEVDSTPVISITVTPGTWTAGDAGLNETQETGLDQFSAKNEGSVAENFTIVCGNSDNWTCGAAAAPEVFAMKAQGGDLTDWTAINISQTLEPDVAVSGAVDFGLQLTTPTATIYTNTMQEMFVTITASQH